MNEKKQFIEVIDGFKNLTTRIKKDNDEIKEIIKNKDITIAACKREYKKLYAEHEELKRKYDEIEKYFHQEKQQKQNNNNRKRQISRPWERKKRHFIIDLDDDDNDDNIDNNDGDYDEYDADNDNNNITEDDDDFEIKKIKKKKRIINKNNKNKHNK